MTPSCSLAFLGESNRPCGLVGMGRSAYFPKEGGEDARIPPRRAAGLPADGGRGPGHYTVCDRRPRLRKVVPCEAVTYREWGPQELLELSLAADDPELILPVWRVYPQVRQDDPLAGGAQQGSPLPHREWLGQALAISDFISDREFRRRGLYAEVCKPLGVRAVTKVFLPTGGATGASFVFDTIRSRFTEIDCVSDSPAHPPGPGRLRRNAHAWRTYWALIDPPQRPDQAAAPHATRRAVLARAAAGVDNTVIAQAPSSSPGTIRKHLDTSTTSSKSVLGEKQP